MADTRAAKPDDAVGEANSDAAAADRNLDQLPDGLRPLKTIHTETVEKLLSLAEEMVADARKRFGRQSAKPRIKQVEELFLEHAGKAPDVERHRDEAMRQIDTVEKVATLDQAYDKSVATALNAFDKTSGDAGRSVQDAYDKWTMAVRIYRSEARSAGTIFYAEIEKAKSVHPQSDAGTVVREQPQIAYYTRGSAIAQALVTYEQTMAKSASTLVAAFGALMTGLYTGFASTAVGEATLVSASQTATLTFWTGVQQALRSNRS